MCQKSYVFNIELNCDSQVLMRSESWLLIRLYSLDSLDKSEIEAQTKPKISDTPYPHIKHW